MPPYSLWMLEYSRCQAQPLGCIFYGEWSGRTRPFSYSYVYIEGARARVMRRRLARQSQDVPVAAH